MALADYTTVKIDELEGFYNGIFLKARAALGVTAFGLSIVDIPAGSVHYPEHSHPSGQEEVLIPIKGFGRLVLSEGVEYVDLEPGMMVRIGAKTKRTIQVGDEGLQAVAIGGTPGEPFKALPYTELGAIDPLQKRPGT
jgi:mannose-6-phosphate isomerase-like protein (cupin superfamily)